ncbi:hypothetical protein QQF64_011494 [Cirrhinus molitorella]|uniref:Secreted protein n=1 Tax=Cirrhinus molitorella TaxID=172907 RepID=A0ABR3M0Z2_9TELE
MHLYPSSLLQQRAVFCLAFLIKNLLSLTPRFPNQAGSEHISNICALGADLRLHVIQTCPRSQWSTLLRQSIIDDEIWQAVEPYGPFFLPQLLVFPQLICADQVVCRSTCLGPYVTGSAYERSSCNFPLFNTSQEKKDRQTFRGFPFSAHSH